MNYLLNGVMLLEPVTGFDAILAQISNLTTVVGNVFTIITGNAYLCFFAVVGVVIAAIRIFRKLKRAAK